MNLKDKNGKPIPNNSVIVKRTLKNDPDPYWSIWKKNGVIHMFACQEGYRHHITQSDIKDFELIGSYEQFKHLLACD